MTGVQLIGKKAVLTRYEKLECDAWALYQGKQFIVGGVGYDSLSDWLQDFEQSGSTATYTLRVYDFAEAPTSSMGNSDYVVCVHFKITDTYEGYGIAGHSSKLSDRITGIENELKKLNKPDLDDDDDRGVSMGAIVSDWLENPEKLAVIAGIFRQFFPGAPAPVPMMVPAKPVQTISGFKMETEFINAASPEGLERMTKALDILGQYDPNIVKNLEALAQLAKDQPALYGIAVQKLDSLRSGL
jgi:hypothetical protein